MESSWKLSPGLATKRRPLPSRRQTETIVLGDDMRTIGSLSSRRRCTRRGFRQAQGRHRQGGVRNETAGSLADKPNARERHPFPTTSRRYAQSRLSQDGGRGDEPIPCSQGRVAGKPMTTCSNCGSADVLDTKGPWWMGRTLARLYNVVQCAECKRYINKCSGQPVLPLACATLAAQSVGVIFIVVLGCIGESIELWFGIPFVLFFGLSCIWVLWIARTHHLK